ncbi:hypothetical protein ABZ619_13695 [Streptomyces sp. NPDC007851]|uniref:proline-rich domain-containing protein n=1 Tax=Streptomyces sp. NPDC007851 TaxID=3155008 RepID=UPI0033D032D1
MSGEAHGPNQEPPNDRPPGYGYPNPAPPGHGLPQQGPTNPQGAQTNPQQEPTPPPQGSALPSQGSAPSPQRLTPPSQGSAPPQQGFAPSPQGPTPPSQGFAAPAYGFAPPGYFVPPMPAGPPAAAPDGLRAVVVGLLNLSGLGLGYLLVRRRLLTAACLVATVVLLLVALPADADGVPGAALVCYAVLLLSAAVHGAFVGLRTRLVWPGRRPVALLLGVALLAVPVGGALWYDSAHQEAVQRALLHRLDQADEQVTAAARQDFAGARADYQDALAVYRDLAVNHSGSRAAAQVPDRLRTYYTTVAAAYGHHDYCTAVAPLKYLRTVPDSMPKNQLGTLVHWPDDRLATALYECGADGLAGDGTDWVARFDDLLATFPHSAQAAKVVPAVDAAEQKAAKAVSGSDPCTAVDRLHTLNSRIVQLSGVSGAQSGALGKVATRAGRSGDAGEYQCGVEQYKDGDYAKAQATMEQFVTDNPHDHNGDRARKIAIGAEVAQTLPAAGKKLPTTASGGGISVTVKNDSPDDITVLFTGPVTGSFTLKACGGCKAYSFASSITPGWEPCSDRGRAYPQRTISLPPGTTYFVHKPKKDTSATPGSDTAKLRYGYVYTECAYTTQSLGSGY